MKKIPRISDAEWQVMQTLWNKAPQTANEIVATLSQATSWKRETIRTLINRLVQKKAVGFEQRGRQYHYYPRVGESDCVRAEAKSLVERFQGGSLEPMLAAFVEHAQLSKPQIQRLRQILDGKSKGRKNT